MSSTWSTFAVEVEGLGELLVHAVDCGQARSDSETPLELVACTPGGEGVWRAKVCSDCLAVGTWDKCKAELQGAFCLLASSRGTREWRVTAQCKEGDQSRVTLNLVNTAGITNLVWMRDVECRRIDDAAARVVLCEALKVRWECCRIAGSGSMPQCTIRSHVHGISRSLHTACLVLY